MRHLQQNHKLSADHLKPPHYITLQLQVRKPAPSLLIPRPQLPKPALPLLKRHTPELIDPANLRKLLQIPPKQLLTPPLLTTTSPLSLILLLPLPLLKPRQSLRIPQNILLHILLKLPPLTPILIRDPRLQRIIRIRLHQQRPYSL